MIGLYKKYKCIVKRCEMFSRGVERVEVDLIRVGPR